MKLRGPLLLSVLALAVALPAPAQPPPPPGGVAPEQLQAVLDQVRQELAAQGLDSADDIEQPDAGLASWPDLTSDAAQPPIRELEHPADRSVRILTQPLRHTTIMLGPNERIVDIVVGDAIYFEATGADNVVFIKPMQPDRRTSLSLTTNYDRTYAFDVFATEAYRPDEVVRVLWADDAVVEEPEDGRDGVGPGLVRGFAERRFELDIVPVARLGQLREQIALVRSQHARVEEDAAAQLASVEQLADARYQEFLRTYPRRIEARYRLSPEIQSAPLFVHQMFTDGQFTYARSTAQESPAFYTLTGADGSEPRLVNVRLTPDGFYLIDHVVAAGFAQLHGARGEWHVWDLPPMSLLPEVVAAGLPQDGLPPRWIRAGEARSWRAKHPKLLKWIIGGGVTGVATIFVIRAIR